MKLWRISWTGADGEHKGYSWFTTEYDAIRESAQRSDKTDQTEIEWFNVPCTRSGVVRALDSFAGHPNNG